MSRMQTFLYILLQDVIFTDESRLQTHQNRKRFTYHKRGVAPKQTPKPKHPVAVLVWAGISKRGTTKILVFEKIMKSEFYQEEILRQTLLPFIRDFHADGHRFMQDNDPKHTSNSTKVFMQDNNINWWPTPPESPDMNPIELVWKELKDFAEVARTRDELVERIMTFWDSMTPQKCERYINHLQKVLPKVVESEGGPSGE